MKYGGKAMKGMGKAANATGKSAGHAVLHPSQTLRGAGQAVKTATAGAAVGYVGWEKLTTDKSVARIVSEAVVGKSATDALAGTTEDMKELKDKAGETVSAIGEAVGGADSKLNGVSNFLREASGGGLFNMLSGFLRNLGGGNVSGLNIAGLIAAAYLVFGRFGWLGKIAGLFLGMMLIGNNAGVVRTVPSETVSRTQTPTLSPEEQTQSGGMRDRNTKIYITMKYTEEMILHSDSGYCMPFEEPQGKDVEMSLGYGEQVHPATGEKFFHHGIDFNVRCYMLSAVASGIVSGVGNDRYMAFARRSVTAGTR